VKVVALREFMGRVNCFSDEEMEAIDQLTSLLL
jgi:hypothetical protein